MFDASNAPWVPYPPRFEDLTERQSQSVRVACLFARRRIADAISVLKGAQKRPSPQVMTHFKITDASAVGRVDLQTIIDNYHQIVGALLGHQNLAFEVENADFAYEEALRRGAEGAIEPHTVSDDNGSARHSAIKTYGDTIHSFWDLQDYNGPFLPGFKGAQVSTMNAGLKAIDHVVGKGFADLEPGVLGG